MNRTIILTVATSLAATLGARVDGADWTQFRGPNHDGSTSEKILTSWPAGGLTEVWKHPLKDGFSAISVGGGKAFTLVKRDIDGADQEVCVALDANSGNELWAVPLGIAKYDGGGDSGTSDNKGGDGPRSTPAYDNGKVYTYSSKLVLKCMDAASGRQIWASDIVQEHGGRNITWQNASSPVLEGNLIFVAGGGQGQALLAFDRNDGHVVWKTQDDQFTHSTPIVATILGQRQVIFLTQTGLVSVVPSSGNVLWRYPFKYSTSTAISPVVSDDIVYCSAAYGVGAGACKITKTDSGFQATKLWFQPANVLQSHWSTPVASHGYLYAINGQKLYGGAPMVCVELATGNIIWSQKGFGPGGCTLVDGCVLVLSDAGDLVLVKATPDGYQEAARSHVLAGKCWNSASVSGGRIYARSTKEGVSLDASIKTSDDGRGRNSKIGAN